VNNPARIRAPTFEDLQETERKYGSKAGEAMRRIFHPDQPRADGSVTSNPPDQKMPGLQPPERKSPPSRWNVRPSSAPVTLGKEFEDQLRRGLPDMQPPGVAQPGQPVFPQPQSWQDPSQR
jgi:hypothetical protein